jgi:hypothetical protein
MYIKTNEDGSIQAIVHSSDDIEDMSEFELMVSVPEDVMSNPAGYLYIDGVFSEKPPEVEGEE